MNTFTKSLLAATLALSVSIPYATAETRQVGPVVWNTETAAKISDNVPNNKSQLIFVRFADNLPTTTNANISIDDDYQISLQSGHLSNVLVCAGDHKLSAQSTAHKSNDLLFNDQTITTLPKQTYYYRVQATANGDTTITPLDASTKVNGQLLPDYLASVPKQAHQISRVTPACPVAVAVPVPVPVVIMPAPIVIKAQPQPEPKPLTPKPAPIEFNQPIELGVLFNFDSAVVVPQYYSRISEMAQFIKDNDATAIIEGHTDSRGDNTYNMQLSQQRADAVKNLLVSEYSVNPAKLTTQGFGETRPIASNDTEAGRQQNRRVLAIAHP